MSEPAYTPQQEYDCDSSSTHYQGCKCHEARRNAEIERLREALREFTLPPYHDSNLKSWAEWVNARAIALLGDEGEKGDGG